MAEYLYRCGKCKSEQFVRHNANEDLQPECRKCGAAMHKIPIAVRLNGVGLPVMHPNIQRLVETADKRRDEYAAMKEQRNE